MTHPFSLVKGPRNVEKNVFRHLLQRRPAWRHRSTLACLLNRQRVALPKPWRVPYLAIMKLGS